MDLEEAKRQLEEWAFKSFEKENAFEKRGIKEIKGIVHQLMNKGIYHDDFLDIIDERITERDHFMRPFKKVCSQLGIIFPSDLDNATFLATKRIMTDIISGYSSPKEGIYEAFSLYYSLNGELYDLVDWWAYYYSFDGKDDNGKEYNIDRVYESHREEIDKEILEMTQGWLDKFNNN